MASRAAISFPPRMMRRPTAAAYLDMTQPEFEREVAAGRLPMPIVGFGNVERWSSTAIDAAVDQLTGERVVGWRDKARLYGSGE